MSSKSKRISAYRTRVERRIRRFYCTLVLLGALLAIAYFVVWPYLTGHWQVWKGKGRREAVDAPPVEALDTEQSGTEDLPHFRKTRLSSLEEDLAISAASNEVLRAELVRREEALRDAVDRLERDAGSIRTLREQLTAAEELAEERGVRLAEAQEAAVAYETRLADMEARTAALAEVRKQNEALMEKHAEAEQKLEQAAVRESALQNELAALQNEEFRHKQAMVALYEQMQSGHTNDVLLDSVAAAQWRLLRYETEWVVRTLSSMPAESRNETVQACISRLKETLYPE